MSARLLGYIVFEPERQSQLCIPPRGKQVGELHSTVGDAAEYIVDHDKVGAWRVCRLVLRNNRRRWERLSNGDEYTKGRILLAAETGLAA